MSDDPHLSLEEAKQLVALLRRVHLACFAGVTEHFNDPTVVAELFKIAAGAHTVRAWCEGFIKAHE